MSQIWNIARKELSDGLRNRWLLAISLLFAVLAVGIAWLGAAASGQLGFTSIPATIASLASLATFLVPLIALLLAYERRARLQPTADHLRELIDLLRRQLRVREGDIGVLAEHFGRRMAAELDWDRWPGFAPHVMDALEDNDDVQDVYANFDISDEIMESLG